ncbi:hypothetical protein B0H17DRAFT_1124487 [Mycena rosella]|uniref:Uncharacterized protein n=1 Tax=Mycena rosella TaxID=1033263 RepID=A0AAD7GZR1_MYCRO|nr:hypothetical protein B0H17DRAFT_1124487 [Mycena rosella]
MGATGKSESERHGTGTAEPVHKGRKGTVNELQSNPVEWSSKSRRLVRGQVKQAEGPKQSTVKGKLNCNLKVHSVRGQSQICTDLDIHADTPAKQGTSAATKSRKHVRQS